MKFVNILMLSCTMICVFSCTKKDDEDAISGATQKYDKDKKVILPPKSDSYITLGAMAGLKGFVVKYDEKFYRGGELYSKEGIQSLKSLGITTIISVTPTDTERELTKKHNFTLFEIPYTKEAGLSKADLDKVISILKEKNMPIYAHCRGGSHRGGILGLIYRIYKNNWPLEKALLEFGYLGGSLKDDQKMIQSIKKR